MEAFAFYLLKSVIWLSGFALVYLLFLRNERYFLLNRFYLLSGILASLIFPFISIRYTVIIPVTESLSTGNIAVTAIENYETYTSFNFNFLILLFYIVGALFVAYKVFKQSRTIIRIIKKAEVIALHSVKLIRTPEYTNSFSYFSYVFVNPSVTDIETKEIVNHELAHIRQWHWIDLVLVELLCMVQWFNPVIWIYIRFIRQNHEYLADEVALQRTSDPALYRAALLNQIVGSPVIILANSFNYSINKKRFNMMKNKISSPYRKMKLLLILPVIAVVLYSFAKPEYKYISDNESNNNASAFSSQEKKEVKGTIVRSDGKPLNGASVVIRGTTMGAVSDSKGSFMLNNVQEDGMLVVSYIGYKSKVIKPVFTAGMIIKMESDTVSLRSIGVPPPPPPPPPVSEVRIRNTNGSEASPLSEVKIRNTDGSEVSPLIVIDGVKRGKNGLKEIDANQIGKMMVLKDKQATDLYGEEGKDGVIEITTRKPGEKLLNDTSKIKVTGYGQLKTPPLDGLNIRSQTGGKPLLIVNGVVSEIDISSISPNSIESIRVKKNDQTATALYGEKAKDGVIEITLKPEVSLVGRNNLPDSKMESVKVTGYGSQQKDPGSGKDTFVLTEEMPSFPGGEKAIQSYLYSNIKVIKGSEKISEPVLVVFTVDSKGKVRDAQVLKKKYPVWEAEAIRVVSSMPDWKPGVQNGKPIDVIMQLPIDFSTVKN